ncbi:hypothetical protein KUF83_37305 [Streptomyces sp. BV286]|nr:hypothetical protein [Streptomyces sp. BV286]MBV1942168.1 hypothetical protein [Streptomyces sp. BV286]
MPLPWHRALHKSRFVVEHDNYQGKRNPFIDHPEWVGAIWQTEGDLR